MENQELLSPKYDLVFHALFRKGNEKITKALIQDITNRQYKIIKMDQNTILWNDNPEDKEEVLDLKVELDDGEICNIEIQLANQKNMKERFLEYWAKLYSGQLEKGDNYDKLKRTILIAIVNFDISDLKGENYHTIWKIIEEKNRKNVLTNDFELHIINIKKGKKALKANGEDKIAQWMSFFDNPNSKEVRNMSKENEDINDALEQLRKLSANKALRERLDWEEKNRRDREAIMAYKLEEASRVATENGMKQGIEQGMKQGEKNEKQKIAKEMLKRGVEIKLIVECTGLTEKEIEKLNQK